MTAVPLQNEKVYFERGKVFFSLEESNCFLFNNYIEVSMQAFFDQATCSITVEGQGSYQHASSAVKHKYHLFCRQLRTPYLPFCPNSQAGRAVQNLVYEQS